MAAELSLEKKNRLIVLVPDSLAGNLELARKVLWIAIRENRELLYLALFNNDDEMLSVTRGLITMKAATDGNYLVVNGDYSRPAEWVPALRQVCEPGDTIVVQEEQFIRSGNLS